MKVKELQSIFGSQMKAQEMILLLKNEKTVVRQGFYDTELKQVQQFCKKNTIHIVLSQFKVIDLDAAKEFSNSGERVPLTDPRNGMRFVYFSTDEKKALLAALFEQNQDHIGLGQELGYPHCCCVAFVNSFSPTNTDLELPTTNPYTNISYRKKDKAILSHFPCSSECKPSIQLAKKYLTALESADPTHAEKLKEFLFSNSNKSL